MSRQRVFLGSVATETNTFSPLRSDLRNFKEGFYAEPGQHPETPTLCSAIYTAARARAEQYGWHLIEGTASWAEPGGMVNQDTWHFLRDQLLGELEEALPVDVVLLGLHGAMVAQGCLDCEGELIERVRQVAGPSAVIGVTFDPHSHLSQRRVENADIITVFKEFPHVDFLETAERLAELACRAAKGMIVPRISAFDCRMIDVFPTSRQPMRGFIDRIKALEGRNGTLSISVIHGFMAGDVPDLGARTIVVTDDRKAEGDRLAEELGMELYALRGQLGPELLTPSDALNRAAGFAGKPVVIADVWDNPGGGVPGDSTTILKRMMAMGVKNAALACIWDPIAVRTCLSAGKDSRLTLRFGAKMSADAGDPVDAQVTVRQTMRNAVQGFSGSVVSLGDCAWIEVDGIDVVLSSLRSQVFSPEVFSNLGIDPLQRDMLVIKSTNHFHDAFSPIAAQILYVAVDGLYPGDPASNHYQNLARAIWPMSENPHGDITV